MKKMNYEVINRYGKLSVKPINKKRNIRIERAFGENYTIKNITDRIFNTESIRVPFPEARSLKGRYKSKGNSKMQTKTKVKGIRALYFHYCYLLKVYPNKKRVISKELREEIKKMENISQEARFLSSYKIKTAQELLNLKSSSITRKSELRSKRSYLWKKYNKSSNEEDREKIKSEIDELTKEINNLTQKIKMMEDIESRIPKMKENINAMQDKRKNKNLEGKELNEKHEYI